MDRLNADNEYDFKDKKELLIKFLFYYIYKKRMKKYLILGFLFLGFNLYAQEKKFNVPNFLNIQSQVTNSTSNYFYPKLLKRLHNADTTLTTSDFHHLYYGFAFQETYQNLLKINNETLKYMNRIKEASLNNFNYNEYIKISHEELSKNPLNLYAVTMLSYLYGLKKDNDTALKWTYINAGMMNAFLSSGDGNSCESAYHILLSSHINYLMLMLEVKNTSTPHIDNAFICTRIDFGETLSLFFNTEQEHKKSRQTLLNNNK